MKINNMNEIVIIIPSYNPNKKLIEIVERLNDKVSKQIIIINDGSKTESNIYFENLSKKATILVNNINKGKGYSLKKAMNWFLKNEENILGVITVDADGQHSLKDINRIAKKLKENLDNNQEKIILGARNFKQKNVPLKNKIGNIINSYIMQKSKKIKIKDTQTGLRGIPAKYLNELSQLEGDRYEYEQNMLLYIIDKKIPFEELDIETIYNKENRTHYRTIQDTYKILKTYHWGRVKSSQ